MNRLQGHVLGVLGVAFALALPGSAAAKFPITTSDGGKTVDTVTRGKCKVKGKKGNRAFFLYAKSDHGKFKIEALIDDPPFEGFGEVYTVYYGSDDPQITLTRLADRKQFSNFKLPGTPAGTVFAGGIAFRKQGKRVGVGLYGAVDRSGKEAYSFAGPINCRYPRR